MMTSSLATSAFNVSNPRLGGVSIKTYAYSLNTEPMRLRKEFSRPIRAANSSSAAAKSIDDGASERLLTVVGTMTCGSVTPPSSASSPTRTWYTVRISPPGSTPKLTVALACGSMSMTRVLRPLAAMQAARLTAVVVFAHPPFWLTNAITRADPECVTQPSLPSASCTPGQGMRTPKPGLGRELAPQVPVQPSVDRVDYRRGSRVFQRTAPAQRAADEVLLTARRFDQDMRDDRRSGARRMAHRPLQKERGSGRDHLPHRGDRCFGCDLHAPGLPVRTLHAGGQHITIVKQIDSDRHASWRPLDAHPPNS